MYGTDSPSESDYEDAEEDDEGTNWSLVGGVAAGATGVAAVGAAGYGVKKGVEKITPGGGKEKEKPKKKKKGLARKGFKVARMAAGCPI